jgi:small subunit ribosomal protein S6
MMTAYEAIYVIAPDFSEEQVAGVVEKYSNLITKNEGAIVDLDRWPMRRLAYEIKAYRDGANRKYRDGIYVVMNFNSEPACKDELDRIFRISDDVIRFMVIKQEPKADRFPSQGPFAGGGPIRIQTRYSPRSVESSENAEASEVVEATEVPEVVEAPVAPEVTEAVEVAEASDAVEAAGAE